MFRRLTLSSTFSFLNWKGNKFFSLCRGLAFLVLCLLAGPLLLVGCSAKVDHTFPEGMGALFVSIEGLRNNDGEVIVSLFADAEGFPEEMVNARQHLYVKVESGRAHAVLRGLPYGKYALSVLHDENMDGQMESSWLGQPREGFGFSGRPEYNFGPPSFADSMFLLLSATQEVVVWMRYETERQKKQNDRRADQDGKQ